MRLLAMFSARILLAFIFTISVLPMAASSKSKQPNIRSVSPQAIMQGHNATITVVGDSLSDVSDATVVVGDAPAGGTPQKAGNIDKVGDGNTVEVHLQISNAVPAGSYLLQLKNASGAVIAEVPFQVVSSTQQISPDTYICAGSVDYNPITMDGRSAHCQISIMSSRETKDIFGTRVGSMYYALQITIQNRDADHEFLVRDVVMRYSDNTSASTRVLSLVQGVAEKGQLLSPRNLTLRILESGGALAGAFSVFPFFTTTFKDAVNIFQGPGINGFRTVAPDFTVNQVNRLNAMVFDDNKATLLPKGGSSSKPAVVVVLLPHDNKHDVLNKGIMHVEIVGTAIQPAAQPTLSVSANKLDFGELKVGDEASALAPITVQNLSSAQAHVQVSTSPDTPADFAVTSNTCTSGIPAGGSCRITLSCAAKAVGARAGTLKIRETSTGNDSTVAMLATGEDSILITGAPNQTLEFTSLGQQLSIALSPSMSQGLTVSSNIVSGSDNFTADKSDCEGKVLGPSSITGAKQTCTIKVTYSKAGNGSSTTGTLEISTKEDGLKRTILLKSK